MKKGIIVLVVLVAILISGCSMSKLDEGVKPYTPSISGDNECLIVDNVSFVYRATTDYLYISGRFRVVSAGSGDGFITISYPDGIKGQSMGVGSVGTVALSKAYNGPDLTLRTSSETTCFIQAGAGNQAIQVIGDDTYVLVSALIPRIIR